jgi:hypothetical protein
MRAEIGAQRWCDVAFHPPLARVSETLRRSRGQPSAVQIEVGQSEAGAEPVVVLGQAAISGLLEAEDTFEYPEGMLDLGSHARLIPVLRAL